VGGCVWRGGWGVGRRTRGGAGEVRQSPTALVLDRHHAPRHRLFLGGAGPSALQSDVRTPLYPARRRHPDFVAGLEPARMTLSTVRPQGAVRPHPGPCSAVPPAIRQPAPASFATSSSSPTRRRAPGPARVHLTNRVPAARRAGFVARQVFSARRFSTSCGSTTLRLASACVASVAPATKVGRPGHPLHVSRALPWLQRPNLTPVAGTGRRPTSPALDDDGTDRDRWYPGRPRRARLRPPASHSPSSRSARPLFHAALRIPHLGPHPLEHLLDHSR